MDSNCRIPGCKSVVPVELAGESICPLHFTVMVEQKCADLRRETVGAAPAEERRAEILTYLARTGEMLARVGTGSQRLPDEMKARILNTFLTLMNLRENLDRIAIRQLPRREVNR